VRDKTFFEIQLKEKRNTKLLKKIAQILYGGGEAVH